MKRLSILAVTVILFALSACKGNPSTTSGDSTGTGAVGARVPGDTSSDTTRRGPAIGADAKDTTKTPRDTSSR